MKNLVFGIIATILFGFIGSAQTSKIDLEKMFGPLINNPIDKELKVESRGVENDQLFPFYIKEKKAWLILVGNEDGLVSLFTSDNLKLKEGYNQALRSVPYPATRRCEDKPSNLGVVLCVANTVTHQIVSAISSWFN